MTTSSLNLAFLPPLTCLSSLPARASSGLHLAKTTVLPVVVRSAPPQFRSRLHTAPTMVSEKEMEATLADLRQQDPDVFDRVVGVVKYKAREPRPLFPKQAVVRKIPTIPSSEQEAFKKSHIDQSAIKDYNSPEAHERLSPPSAVRDAQYKRWKWACDNYETYVNMLRLSDHDDDNIQAMMEGRPLCFSDAATFIDLSASLRALGPKLEKEHGWSSVGFVFTGSSVPGFSQNPLKGRYHEPTRITSVSKSDVDICIKGDGVEQTVEKLRSKGVWTAGYPTTCSPTRSGTRYGVDWSFVKSGALGEFYEEWSNRLPGGLQITLCEDALDMPPWESTLAST